jgi:hypothetical protein
LSSTWISCDHYSYDTVETVKAAVARWQSMRRLREWAQVVDRLRASARRIVLDSPDFKGLLKDAGVRISVPIAP